MEEAPAAHCIVAGQSLTERGREIRGPTLQEVCLPVPYTIGTNPSNRKSPSSQTFLYRIDKTYRSTFRRRRLCAALEQIRSDKKYCSLGHLVILLLSILEISTHS